MAGITDISLPPFALFFDFGWETIRSPARYNINQRLRNVGSVPKYETITCGK